MLKKSMFSVAILATGLREIMWSMYVFLEQDAASPFHAYFLDLDLLQKNWNGTFKCEEETFE